MPILPDDFFAVLDAARAKIATSSRPAAASGSTLTVRQGFGFGEDVVTPAANAEPEAKYYDWKSGTSDVEREHGAANVSVGDEEEEAEDEEEEEESTAEESVSGTDEDDSREIEATPRPRDGFQP